MHTTDLRLVIFMVDRLRFNAVSPLDKKQNINKQINKIKQTNLKLIPLLSIIRWYI